MQRITPHLWFDKEAMEAAELYTSTFAGGAIKRRSQIHDTPSGTVDMVTIEIQGLSFTLISAGPMFRFNPSISFLVTCATADRVDALWKRLAPGGKALMELDRYPFSERYGWVQDRYGLSWQLMFMGGHDAVERIVPSLLFVGAQCGRAEEAMRFYASVFHGSRVGDILRYAGLEAPDKEGTVKHASFSLEGQEFTAMDSAHRHEFAFNEAISLMVNCDTQAEIDYYWDRLSADPKAEQCGWLKDRFGLSWQVVPTAMDRMMSGGDRTRLARVARAFLKMKKFDLAELERAYGG